MNKYNIDKNEIDKLHHKFCHLMKSSQRGTSLVTKCTSLGTISITHLTLKEETVGKNEFYNSDHVIDYQPSRMK